MGAKGFRQAGHPPSLVATLLHFDVSFMVWVLLGALGAYVAADLDLGSTQKGLMVAVPPLGGAFGLAKVSAAGYAALCAAAGSFLRPLGGALSDRWGGTRVLSGAMLAVGALAAGPTLLPDLAATLLLLFTALGCLGVGNGAVFPLVPRRFPQRIGAVTGLVGAAGGVGGFILPFALGSLEELTGSFALGFLFMASAATVAAWAVARRDRIWRRNPAQLEVAVA